MWHHENKISVKYRLFIFLNIFLVCACSVTREFATEQYLRAKPCCQSVSEFRYKNLPSDEVYIADLNEDSPAFEFATGKSYFIALKLPSYLGKYGVIVKSFALGDYIDEAHIFYPKILLLDKQFLIVNENKDYSFVISKLPFMAAMQEEAIVSLPIKLQGLVRIDNQKAKYMVIMTTDDLLSDRTPYSLLRYISIILPGVVGAIPTHRETIMIPHSPFGRISVSLDKDIAKPKEKSE
jgi:hypothetical protein